MMKITLEDYEIILKSLKNIGAVEKDLPDWVIYGKIASQMKNLTEFRALKAIERLKNHEKD